MLTREPPGIVQGAAFGLWRAELISNRPRSARHIVVRRGQRTAPECLGFRPQKERSGR
jgi:hypothetical protein